MKKNEAVFVRKEYHTTILLCVMHLFGSKVTQARLHLRKYEYLHAE